MSIIRAVPFDREFLEKSRVWLRDSEIKKLTMAPVFSDNEQEEFFVSLPQRTDYLIFGIMLDAKEPIGVLGLKNIKQGDAEYWGYIGEKQYWGHGFGRWMLGAAEKTALSLGINRLWLKVAKFNTRAIGLYEKNGYVLLGNEVDLLIYEKEIQKVGEV